MSLETEIKKLTDAVIALTAVMQGGQARVSESSAQAAVPAHMTLATPEVAGPGSIVPPSNIVPPQFGVPVQAPQVNTAATMTLQDAQRELAVVMQRLGESGPAKLMGLLGQYGKSRLSECAAHELPAIVAAAQKLV